MKDKLKEYLGKEGHITLNGMQIPVKIVDYNNNYGKENWLVTPIGGAGTCWVRQNPIERTTVVIEE